MLGRVIDWTFSWPSKSVATRDTNAVIFSSFCTDGLPWRKETSSFAPVTLAMPSARVRICSTVFSRIVAVERSHGAVEHHLFGDDVVVLSAVDLAERNDDGVLAVGCPGDELIERADELGGGGDRIVRFVRASRVAAAAADGDSHVVATRGERARLHADGAGPARGIDMGGDNRVDAVECAGRDHRFRAVA